MEYEVKLEIFEGPLDLLIHLINKNEVDIFDIPISRIADQYLEYLDMMEALNVSVAGDFLVMASTLIHIKSKTLLPDFGDIDDEEDPRLEITRPLLEYMQLKEKAQELGERNMLGRDVFSRQESVSSQRLLEGEAAPLEVSLFQLMDAFRQIMDQHRPGSGIHIQSERWSIKEKSQFILDVLKKRSPIFFHDLFNKEGTVSEFIVTFLALLELVHSGFVKLLQTSHRSDIKLMACFEDNTDDSSWKNH